jgi:hypothetical protein
VISSSLTCRVTETEGPEVGCDMVLPRSAFLAESATAPPPRRLAKTKSRSTSVISSERDSDSDLSEQSVWACSKDHSIDLGLAPEVLPDATPDNGNAHPAVN